MGHPGQTCWCDRHPGRPCLNPITAEDMLCNLCRPRDCRVLVVGSDLDGFTPAGLQHVRAWFS